MSTWRDIDINLLYNAIWAIGGYIISQLALLKKIISPAPFFKKASNTTKNIFSPSDDVFAAHFASHRY